MKSCFEVKNLTVIRGRRGNEEPHKILSNINLKVSENECVGIIGGSGAGKTVLLNSLINSPRTPLTISEGVVDFEGEDLLKMPKRVLQREILGKKIASICPNPHLRLDPINTIGQQISDIYTSHFKKATPKEAKNKVIELLHKVGIPDPDHRYNSYPVELSGGMAQRVLVTIALICKPTVLLADEPTGGLDVTIQIQVFKLIQDLIKEENLATIIASRDIGLIYHLSDWIYVMNHGKIVEYGLTDEIINNPMHPYTTKLVRLAESDHRERLEGSFNMHLNKDLQKYHKFINANAESKEQEVSSNFYKVSESHFVAVEL